MELQFIPIQHDKKHANRHLLVLDVSEVARVLGASVAVSYLNVMDPGAIAGNHRHVRKLEAMRAVVGRLQVDLLDVATGERETVILDDSGDDTYGLCLIIPPGCRACSHEPRNDGRGDRGVRERAAPGER